MNFPFEKKSGNTSVTIYRNKNRNRPDGFEYKVAYYDEGRRRFRSCATFSDAEITAKDILERSNKGEMDLLRLGRDDIVAMSRAKKALKKFGITVDHAAKAYADILKCLPPDVTPLDAARDYAKRHPANMAKKTVSEVVAELVEAKRNANKSLRYVQDLESRAGAFANAFQCNILSVTSDALRAYLDGKKMAPRTYKNHVTTLGTLFEFAKARGFLPKDSDLMDGIEIPEDSHNGEIEIYSADEITALLAHADARIVPAIAIAAFAGLRSAELERLDWKEVRLPEGFIEIKAIKAKTRSRRLIPIADNLRQWLAPYADKTGPVVYDGAGEYFYKLMKKAADSAGITWKRNALRHSFISYRVAITNDAAKVSLEAGNSPAMVFQHYRALVTPEQAKQWFSISPPAPASNVIPMAQAQGE